MGCVARADRAPTNKSSLTVLYPGDERIFGPYWEMPAKLVMFLPLVRLDEHGEFEGVLARSWEHSADYRSWTFHLRSDVRWHDGVPFTASDVQFTIGLFSDSTVLWERPGAVVVDAVDDTTVTFTYRLPTDSPLDAWRVYYPRHLLDTLDRAQFQNWEFWTHPVGDGPYRYVRHVAKTMIELEAVPDYFEGKPAIDRVILKFGEGKLALPELLSGDVDVLGWAERLDALKLATDDRFRVYYENGTGQRAVLWNANLPVFSDASVRRALTLAVDRRELIQAIGFPTGAPIVDGPTSERQLRRGEYPAPLPYDTAEARRLLDAAGWRDRDGDGVRDRNGMPFRFTLMAPGEERQAAVYVQSAFARVGVAAQVSIVELNIVRQRARSADFEAVLAWVDRSRDAQFFGRDGMTHYGNARVAQLLDAVKEVIDPDRRDAIYHEVYGIFREEQPAMFIVPGVEQFVVPRWLHGLSSPWQADPIVNLGHLWIENRAP